MFAVGSLVHLKCGGPTMVVETVRTGAVTCLWFDTCAHLQSFTFIDAVVALATDIVGIEPVVGNPVPKPAAP